MPVIDLHYLPSVSWVKTFLDAEDILIEREENFLKSTYRNRTDIIAANGKLPLSIPIKGGKDHHQLYKHTQISYLNNWQKQHWNSLYSAYGSAPFFEHYENSFSPFYHQKTEMLFDFNLQLLNTILKLLKVEKQVEFTKVYEKHLAPEVDFRSTRKKNVIQHIKPYHQTFADKHGFIENLSIIDLLMNEGPNAKSILLD